jgi:hypothetical protein
LYRYAAALACGRVTQQPHGGLDDAARGALQARRAKQRQAAGTLRACFARLGGTPVQVIGAALDALEWRRPPPAGARAGAGAGSVPGAGGTATSQWLDGVTAQTARQQAGARAGALRGLMLLLGAVRWGGARVGAAAADVDAAGAMIPRAAAAHRAALLARWLAATPCAGDAAAAAAPGPAPPLAAAVLPLHAASNSSHSSGNGGAAAALTAAGAQLAADIVLGAASSSSAAASHQAGAGYRRAVEIGAELYAGGELAALGSLLKAARTAAPGAATDPAPDAPALLFLQALRASTNIAATVGALYNLNQGQPTALKSAAWFQPLNL